MGVRTDDGSHAEKTFHEDQTFANRQKMRVNEKATYDTYRTLEESCELEEKRQCAMPSGSSCSTTQTSMSRPEL